MLPASRVLKEIGPEIFLLIGKGVRLADAILVFPAPAKYSKERRSASMW
jgi:hypothetical protein